MKITLKQLLENEPVEIEVPGVGKVLVREPTRKDRIEAREEVSKLPYYDKLSDSDRLVEIQERLVVKTIVKIKYEDSEEWVDFSWEQYEKMPLSMSQSIYDVVSAFHVSRMLALYKKREKTMQDFLQQMKE